MRWPVIAGTQHIVKAFNVEELVRLFFSIRVLISMPFSLDGQKMSSCIFYVRIIKIMFCGLLLIK